MERVAAIDATDDDLELRLALLGFADALEAAVKAAGPRLHASQVVAAFLGVAIVAQQADIANSIVWAERPPLPDVSLAAAQPVRHPRLQLESIGQLFGSRAPEAPAEAAATNTSLVLTGVIASKDPQRGFGILGSEANRTSLYGVGDALPDGSRLAAVFADRVEVERGGLREVLRLPLGLGATALLVRMAALTNLSGEDLTPPGPTQPRPSQ